MMRLMKASVLRSSGSSETESAAAEHLAFKKFSGARVDVRGWVDEPTGAKKDAWTRKFSDHALLYFEVQKV